MNDLDLVRKLNTLAKTIATVASAVPGEVGSIATKALAAEDLLEPVAEAVATEADKLQGTATAAEGKADPVAQLLAGLKNVIAGFEKATA